jgi:integral membrane protein
VGSVLGRVRIVGFIEGTSFLLLLFIAMPMKYLAGEPMLVQMVGMAHGVLWIAYLAVLLHAFLACQWPFRTLLLGGLASVLPFGPFVFDAKLQHQPSS